MHIRVFILMKPTRCFLICAILTCFLTLQISDGYVWQGQDLLLYSTDKEVNILNTSRSKTKTINVVKNLTRAAAITYNYNLDKICWSDHNLESIQCVHFNRLENQHKAIPVTVITGVLSGDGLACDWFTNKLYWTDSESNRIEVATMDGKYRKVLFWTELDQPRTIALIPMKGLMIWTDWGETPKIERAGMNGDLESRQRIVTKDIFWPNGVTIDYKHERIYWIDAKLSFIDVIDYDGKNRQRVLKSKFEYPHSLTHFENRFYYTDWKTWSIHGYDKNSSNSFKEIEHFSDSVPVDVHVYNAECQPKLRNPCDTNNGGCSHLCLLAPYPPGYSCACPIGIKTIDNRTCANGPENIVLLARRSEICVIYLDSPEYNRTPLINTSFAIGIEYDPVDGYVYWSDDFLKKIQKAKLDGSDKQDVVSIEVESPDGVAIDSASRNLYWADNGADRIEVISLKTGFRKVIISEDLDEPRAVALAPELGWLFWSDWGTRKPKIERSELDGSNRFALVWKDLVWPNGVTVDVVGLKIYWCDAKKDKIEFANMDGTDRRVLISNDVPHVFGLSLVGEYLYWTDWQRRAIDRTHKKSGDQREMIVEQVPNVMGLKVVNLGQKIASNRCSRDNGNCSQICLPRHEKERICACQIDYALSDDGATCVKPKTFLLYTAHNKIGRVSIENSPIEVTLPITGKEHANAIDFDINTMRIYWSDGRSRSIMRVFTNGSDPQKVIESGLSAPNGIAIDWLGLNVYWTDSEMHRIEVARLVGSSRRTLLCGEIYEPRSIVLDPLAGFMYWSEWGGSNFIKNAAMDGSNQRKLISTSGHATGLTLDFDRNRRRLFWVEIDVPTPSILSSDMDGNDKVYVLKDDRYRPETLTLSDDFLFWSDGSTGDIYRTRKDDGSDLTKVTRLSEQVTNLLVFNPDKQKGTNPCAVSNGGCSHLCLTLPGKSPGDPVTFTCACPTHFTLEDNKCMAPNQFMIYSQRNLTVRLVLDTSDCPEAVLPISGLKMVKAIDYDPVHNFLYWIEGKTHSIKRVESTGTLFSTVVAGSSEIRPFDLAVDPLGRLLFWTCAVQDVINVTRLDNNISFGVIQKKDEKPRLLAIHATKRLLFYTDVGATSQLVRTRLDGSQRLVITKTSDITALAIDTENDLIVWTQGHSIYISNIDGENQHVLLNESNSKVTQLAIHSGWLYWIDRELHQLQRLELISGKSRSTVPIQAAHITDLISVYPPDANHSCWHSRRKCSHFCVLNETNPECACPHDKMLQRDERTCVTLPNCGPTSFTCSVSKANTRDCIPMAWRCDAQKDCEDNSDELGCSICLPNQHRCHDGQCIDSAQLCDGQSQCRDNSDELNCCSKNSFQCPETDVCIPDAFVCDGIENCSDGADEKRCDSGRSVGLIVTIVLSVVLVVVVTSFAFYCWRNKSSRLDKVRDRLDDQSSPLQMQQHNGKQKTRKGIPDVVRMSMMNGGGSLSYDRNHITGASSSNGSNSTGSGGYPRETLNPPPSLATTDRSTRASSPSSRYRPYRHYRVINQPPPPTPCSTDVNDESDYNYANRNRYDAPPPTPRSQCASESPPPSPGSRSSTYFGTLPPPPSPVGSPRHYDS